MRRDCRKRIEDEKRDTKQESAKAQVAMTAYLSRTTSAIVADCGASRHLTGQQDWFTSLKKLDQPIALTTASSAIAATHVGSIDVDISPDGKKWYRRVWEDVLFVPGLKSSLYSTTWMERKGYSFSHANKVALLKGKGRTIRGAK